MLLRVLILLLLPSLVWAAIDAYDFAEPAQEQRFRTLIDELRCPKCQNQNISGSNAPLAADLRQKTYDMIRAGRSDAEIMDYMVQRYGDFITYRPPIKPITWPLWYGPLAVVLLTALGLAIWIRRRASRPAVELSAEDRARLDALLNDSRLDNAGKPQA